jgi:hypothetical protein
MPTFGEKLVADTEWDSKPASTCASSAQGRIIRAVLWWPEKKW